MTDKSKPAAATHGREMSRDELIRAHFDAYSDLVWAKDLEPRFREYDLDVDSMRHYREGWNAHTEKRDWAWWQDHVKNWSNDKLNAEIAECTEEIKALGMRQPGRDQATTGGQTFRDIVNRADDSERGTPEPTLTKGRKM
jgi:hypothetical protein